MAGNIDLQNLLLNLNDGWSDTTRIIFPESVGFVDATSRWSSFKAPTFKAVVRPGSEDDVRRIVKLAMSNHVAFLATSAGRHGYCTTFENLQNGIEIDLSAFRSVKVDAEANTMTVGGGAVFNDIYDSLYNVGKEIRKLRFERRLSFQLNLDVHVTDSIIFVEETGACSSVGMVGATLGGGICRYSGIHGLLIDALLEVRLITATGDLITVSKTSEPDLFWGLRGAGMNFGIVIEATYRISDLTYSGEVQSADLIFSASAAAEYFHLLEDFRDTMPKEFAPITFIAANETTHEAQIISNFVYPGPRHTFQEVIQPFLLLKPVVQVIKTIPWNKLVQETGLGVDELLCIKGNPHSIYGVNVRNISGTTYTKVFDMINNLYKSTPAARLSTVAFEHFANQGVMDVPHSATAYPWRDSKGYIMVQMAWSDDSVAPAVNALAREIRFELISTSGFDDLAVYVSYSHGDETVSQIYGADKLTRLVELKREWDPQNAFAFNNALPTEYA